MGFADGSVDGYAVGATEFFGAPVSCPGEPVGVSDGVSVGLSDGESVGLSVGASDGSNVGKSVGEPVFKTGAGEGSSVGQRVGFRVGFADGRPVGPSVGLNVGYAVVGVCVGCAVTLGGAFLGAGDQPCQEHATLKQTQRMARSGPYASGLREHLATRIDQSGGLLCSQMRGPARGGMHSTTPARRRATRAMSASGSRRRRLPWLASGP